MRHPRPRVAASHRVALRVVGIRQARRQVASRRLQAAPRAAAIRPRPVVVLPLRPARVAVGIPHRHRRAYHRLHRLAARRAVRHPHPRVAVAIPRVVPQAAAVRPGIPPHLQAVVSRQAVAVRLLRPARPARVAVGIPHRHRPVAARPLVRPAVRRAAFRPAHHPVPWWSAVRGIFSATSSVGGAKTQEEIMARPRCQTIAAVSYGSLSSRVSFCVGVVEGLP